MVDANQLLVELKTIPNTMSAVYYTYDKLVKELINICTKIPIEKIAHENINKILNNLTQYNRYFGSEVNKLNKQTIPSVLLQLEVNKKADILINDLIKFADGLDQIGNCDLVNNIDNFFNNNNSLNDLLAILTENKIEKCAELADFSDKVGAYCLADEFDKRANDIQRSLSTRYCPDHNGVPTSRVAEHTYQCPIDGKVYNYETGFTNYKGQKIQGGSIAAQSPMASDFGGIPTLIYDNRQSILNRIN